MPITLNWGNYNSPEQFSHTEIYRSTDKSKVYDSENLIATISDKAQVSYTDNTAVREVKYYYGISVSADVGLVRIPPVLATITAFEGVGGSKVIAGNQEFGMIQSSSFRDIYDLATSIALDLLGSIGVSRYSFNHTGVDSADSGLPFMHKMWCDGEIVYVPNIYDFYVNNGTGPATLQRLNDFMASEDRVFELNGHAYEVALMDQNMFRDIVIAGWREQRVVPNRCVPRTVASSSIPSGDAVAAIVLPKEGDDIVYTACNGLGSRLVTVDSRYTGTLSNSFVGWYVRPLKT